MPPAPVSRQSYRGRALPLAITLKSEGMTMMKAFAAALLIGGIVSASGQELEKDESRRREVRSAREQLSKQSRVRNIREMADAITRAREQAGGLTEVPRAIAAPTLPLSWPIDLGTSFMDAI